jgi:hypothetical protein
VQHPCPRWQRTLNESPAQAEHWPGCFPKAEHPQDTPCDPAGLDLPILGAPPWGFGKVDAMLGQERLVYVLLWVLCGTFPHNHISAAIMSYGESCGHGSALTHNPFLGH